MSVGNLADNLDETMTDHVPSQPLLALPVAGEVAGQLINGPTVETRKARRERIASRGLSTNEGIFL